MMYRRVCTQRCQVGAMMETLARVNDPASRVFLVRGFMLGSKQPINLKQMPGWSVENVQHLIPTRRADIC